MDIKELFAKAAEAAVQHRGRISKRSRKGPHALVNPLWGKAKKRPAAEFIPNKAGLRYELDESTNQAHAVPRTKPVQEPEPVAHAVVGGEAM